MDNPIEALKAAISRDITIAKIETKVELLKVLEAAFADERHDLEKYLATLRAE